MNWQILLVAVLLTGGAVRRGRAKDLAPQPPDPAKIEFFEQKIRPLLAEHCLKCHGEKDQEAGLRLDLRAGWVKGGESGTAIKPGKPKESLLIRMVSGHPAKMPPENVLPPPLIADLIHWVEIGAPDPREGDLVAAKKSGIDLAAGRKFWSFQPVAQVEPPAAIDPHNSQPIDRFIAAKWATAHVQPNGRADRATLLRRLSYTLTGLPPTWSEVQAFVQDKRADAYDQAIERLLASPQYGEHQARLWLDLARYGEDQFSNDDKPEANPWRYRDWVIQAFNADLPYDRFLKLQIAADLYEQPGDNSKDRAALGFFALGLGNAFVNDNDRSNAEQWAERIDVMSRSMLGLTVACARCHDHKYDPIPTEDYYSLAGVFASCRNTIVPLGSVQELAAYDAAKKIETAAEDQAREFLQAEADRRALEKADSLVELTIQLWKFHAKKLDEPTLKLEDFAQQAELSAPVLSALEKYLKARTLDKGHYLQPWNELLPKPDGSREPSDALRKYAEQFRDKVKENLQRVLKKRNLDQQKDLFGEKGVFPLVEATILPDANSAWKAHYEALQQTVRELKAKLPPEPARCVACEDHDPHDIQVQLRGNPYKKGAKVPRRFLRVLAGDEPPPFTSGSGRQELAEAIASPTNPLTARVIVNRIWQQDLGQGLVSTPSNFGAQGMPPTHPALLDYLAAQFVREGWSIKRLHRAILHSEAYQRSSAPVAENLQVDPENRWLWRMAPHRLTVEEFRDSILSAAGTLDLHGGGPSDDLDAAKTTRRTIYGKVSRKDLSKLLALWDFADPRISIDRRGESTMPQQMLFLMNSPFMIDNARRVAARLNDLKEPAAQIRRAFELTLVREPTAAELNLVGKFLAAEDPASGAQQKNELTRVERFVHSLLASNEFFFVN